MNAPHRVFLLVFPDFQLLDATGPADVFAAVDEHLPLASRPAYRLEAISPEGGMARSSSGLELATRVLPDPPDVAGCTVLVAGGFGVQAALQKGDVALWLAQAAPYAARCGSVCTGAFLLAQAGLLDGRPVVTHWRYAELLQRLFPRLQVLQDALFVRDATLYSSAGVTAGMDLCLSLVEDDHGRDLSLRVARGLVMYLRRPGGQRQFVPSCWRSRRHRAGRWSAWWRGCASGWRMRWMWRKWRCRWRCPRAPCTGIAWRKWA